MRDLGFLAGVQKAAADDRRVAEVRFQKIKGLLKDHGVMIGAHKRIAIPKHVLSETDLKQHLGFVPVTIAIPEQGQTRFTSFRHPSHNYHVHDHGSHWTMHKDDHPAATMVMRRVFAKTKEQGRRAGRAASAQAAGLGRRIASRAQLAAQTGKAMAHGMPHVVTEGIPGAYYYARGRLTGAGSTLHTVLKGEHSHLRRRLQRWRPTRAQEKQAAAVTARDRAAFMRVHGHHAYPALLRRDDSGFYVATHRARSPSYPSPERIPHRRVQFVASTS